MRKVSITSSHSCTLAELMRILSQEKWRREVLNYLMMNREVSRKNHLSLGMGLSKDFFKLTAVICLVLGCHLTKKTFVNNTRFDIEGHRGCRGLMPENTIPAMYKAIDLDVTTLEMDAVITKDREVVVSHEPFFNHEITTKPDGTEVKES